MQTLDTLLHAGLQTSPEKAAVIHRTGELSYAELHGHANAIAAALLARGVTQGDRVGVLLRRDARLVASLLAILKIGAAYVPLDSSFPIARLRATLEHAEVACLLGSAEFTEPLYPIQKNSPTVFDPESVLEQQTVDALPALPYIDTLSANLIYTSGTTGEPKGVNVSRAAMANLLVALQTVPGLKPEDRVLGLSTIAFDIHALELLAPLTTGATIVLADDQAISQPSVLLELIQQQQVTLIQATPSMWGVLLGAGLPELPQARGVAGGERLAPAIALELNRRLNRCWNMYGPTEATVYTTAKLLEPNSKVSIGEPLSNIAIAVLQIDEHDSDAEEATNNNTSIVQPLNRRVVECGELGELAILGAGLADGYWQDPAASSARFVTLLVDNQPRRAYLSGDLGFIDRDGNVQCEGRIDQQIKLRGHRIELTEIEHALLTHPELNETACSVHSYAQDDNRLVAYHTNDSLTPSELREFIADRLPAYMVPQRFTYLPQLPRLPSGKLDRQSLPRPNLVVESPSQLANTSISADHRVLMTSWEALLGTGTPGASDNFMDQGGHSLLAWRFVQEIETQTGKVLPLRLVILENFNALVTYLESQERTDSNSTRATGAKTGILAAFRQRFSRLL